MCTVTSVLILDETAPSRGQRLEEGGEGGRKKGRKGENKKEEGKEMSKIERKKGDKP